MKTWILVASAARARIFETEGPRTPWRELSDLVNPDDRLHPRDLKTDKPGRAFDSLGGHRHALQTPVDPKEQGAIRFAKEVAEALETGLREGRFDGLWVAAPPHFLGLLREQLGAALTRAVLGDLPKDLTREDVESLQAQLAGFLAR